jgi:hypothetical protein
MLTAGGEAIADIDTLRHHREVLGPVASLPTVWRTLDEMTPAALMRVEKPRARIRRHVWGLFPAVPVSRVAGGDLGEVIVLDVDATLVTAHSEKEQAPGNVQGRLWIPSHRGVVRQHPRDARGHPAAGESWQQPCR